MLLGLTHYCGGTPSGKVKYFEFLCLSQAESPSRSAGNACAILFPTRSQSLARATFAIAIADKDLSLLMFCPRMHLSTLALTAFDSFFGRLSIMNTSGRLAHDGRPVSHVPDPDAPQN